MESTTPQPLEIPQKKRGRPRLHPIRIEPLPEGPLAAPPDRGCTHPHAPDHQKAIQSWSEVCRSSDWPMAASSIKVNETLWSAWCQWLAGESLHWSDASSETIQRFLRGPAPSLRRRHRPAHNASRMSSLTRIRYFRVLKGVYENAFINGWITEPPTLKIPHPEYIPQDAQGAVLPPGTLARLQDAQRIQATFTPTTSSFSQWWMLRDRAVVSLVASTGITTAEIIHLELNDLVAGNQNLLEAMSRAAQCPLSPHNETSVEETEQIEEGDRNASSAMKPPAQWVLNVRPSGNLQGRSFVLPPGVCHLLLTWVKLRETLLQHKAETFATPSERARYMQEHSLHGPLFPSRQGRRPSPGKELSRVHFFPMNNAAVYLIFKRAFAGLGQEQNSNEYDHLLQQRSARAQGPSVIRNTLIQQWLRDLTEEQAQERAGFKTLDAIRVIARVAGIHAISSPLTTDSGSGETASREAKK